MPRASVPARPAEATADALAGIVAAVEDDIVLARLHPQERLVEDALMRRFEAKRHVVREALARLEAMGLVERLPHVGARVRAFAAREVVELYELRTLLEGDAARRIALPAAPAALQALVAIQQRHDAAVQAGAAREVFRVNLEFHQALFAMAGSECLNQAIEGYARRTHAIRFRTLASAAARERSRQQHWQMIEALRVGERETLSRLCREHLQPSRDAYLEACLDAEVDAARRQADRA